MPAPKSFLAHYGMCKLFIDCRQLAGVGNRLVKLSCSLPAESREHFPSIFRHSIDFVVPMTYNWRHRAHFELSGIWMEILDGARRSIGVFPRTTNPQDRLLFGCRPGPPHFSNQPPLSEFPNLDKIKNGCYDLTWVVVTISMVTLGSNQMWQNIVASLKSRQREKSNLK